MNTGKTDVMVSSKGIRQENTVDCGYIELNQVHKIKYTRVTISDRVVSKKSPRAKVNASWHN